MNNSQNPQAKLDGIAVMVRITNPYLAKRLTDLAKEQDLSMNMTVNMLLGYAFNQVDATGKQFKPVVVFESK